MSRPPVADSPVVGILGGGQLALMLADAARRLGLETRVHAEAENCPAARSATRVLTGPLRDFLGQVDVLAFENEFVDCGLLARESRGARARFAPSLGVIEELQDKLRQKRLLERLGVPTSPFAVIGAEDSRSGASEAFERLGEGCVFKWSRMGYDGKGVLLARAGEKGLGEAAEFCARAAGRGIAVYAERRVSFRRELAIVAARGRGGEFAAYPLVVSEQERGICRRVRGPARALGATAEQERQATEFARRVGDELGIEGCFALELFEDADGRLLVNEIAPRVHNSGHYTMDAARTSQFENHWRALLGLPLGPVECAPAFAMLNLLGPDGVALDAAPELLPREEPPLRLHWYHKSEIRPRRKLGHLNGTAPAPEALAALESRMDSCEREWTERLRSAPNTPERTPNEP